MNGSLGFQGFYDPGQPKPHAPPEVHAPLGSRPCVVCGCQCAQHPKIVLARPAFSREGRTEAEAAALAAWEARAPVDAVICLAHARILPGFLAMRLRTRGLDGRLLDGRLLDQMKAALTFRLFGHPFYGERGTLAILQ